MNPQEVTILAYEETRSWEASAKAKFKTKLDTNKTFNSGMVKSLLSHLQHLIDSFNANSTIFNFTIPYKIDLAVYVSNIASRTVKEWSKQHRIANDLIFLLKKLKSKYLKVFINKYKKVATEIAAANQLCNSLINKIGGAVSKCLHIKIINELMRTNKMLRSKLRFKVQVLSDLVKFSRFEFYVSYIKNNDSSLKSWASYYVEQYCYGSKGISDSFKQLAKEEIKIFIKQICIAADIQNYSNVEEWLDQFCALLDGKVEINKEEWIIDNNVNSMDNFIKHLLVELNEVGVTESAYEIVVINYNEVCEKASDKSYRDLIANTCKAQYPFCEETCEVLKNNHLDDNIPHSVKAHRPQCIAGVKWVKSNKLVLQVCNKLVATKNQIVFRDSKIKNESFEGYQSKNCTWKIPGANDMEPPTYWMWVINNFKEDMEKTTGGVIEAIEDSWKDVTKEEAIFSLFNMYELNSGHCDDEDGTHDDD